MAEPGRAREIDELVDDGFFAWMAVWKAQALVSRAIEKAMREYAGLSLTWGEVLSRLGAADGGRLTMNELARQVFVSKSGISQVVSQMSKHELIERQGDPDNLRITYAVLTAHGRDVLKTSTSAFLGAIRENVGQHLTVDEARTIADAMNRLIETLGGTPETPDQTQAIENLYRVVGEPVSAPRSPSHSAGPSPTRDSL